MNKFCLKLILWSLLALCMNPTAPAFAGHDDDAGEFGADADDGVLNPLANFVPLFWPDIDYHRGRGVVQLPPSTLPTMPGAPALPLVPLVPLPVQQAQIPMEKGLPLQKGGEPLQEKLDGGSGVPVISPISDAQDFFDTENSSDLPSDSDDFDSMEPALFPLVIPEGDQHKGRGAVQEPSAQTPKRTFPHRLETPRVDEKHGRQVITLDGGSPDNPYQVVEHGLFYIGALIGVSYVEPNTLIQFNAMSKWKFTKSNSSFRRAENYDEGIRKKWAKYPKKVEDFERWQTGDWIRRTGSFSVAFYVGVSYFAPDARVGVMSEVVKSIHYQKLGPDHVRVSITKEIGGGAIARAQLLPFQKAEAKSGGDFERAYVYLFDLSKEGERKALDDLVQRNTLFAGSEAYHAAKKNEATLLTSRLIKRKKSTFTPYQVGLPLLARARKSWSQESYRTALTTHRGDTKYNFTAKAYYKTTTYRHKNFKKNSGSHKGKRWRHYMDKHQSYSRAYQGGVVKPPRRQGSDDPLKLNVKKDGVLEFVPKSQLNQEAPLTSRSERNLRNQRYLQMQLSFTNDRVHAKKVNSYIKKFFKKIGVNDYMVDVGFRSKALIGYAELRWDLRVGPNAINHIAKEAAKDKHLFTPIANQLIDDYFKTRSDNFKNDPHDLCRSKIKNTELCKRLLRHKTHKTLTYIAKKLRSLDKDRVAKSSKKTASAVAKIAKKLSTNQFVLHAFILKLPPNMDGYGRMKIYGERFLGREFNTDPGQNLREVNSFTEPWADVMPPQGQDEENPEVNEYDNVDSHYDDDSDLEEEEREFDWNRINRRDDVNEF